VCKGVVVSRKRKGKKGEVYSKQEEWAAGRLPLAGGKGENVSSSHTTVGKGRGKYTIILERPSRIRQKKNGEEKEDPRGVQGKTKVSII